MKWKILILVLASSLMQAGYANIPANPGNCPGIKQIAKTGVNQAATSMYGWLGFIPANHFETKDKWSVITLGVSLEEVKTEHQAIKKYNSLLSGFKLDDGPKKNNVGAWECLYSLTQTPGHSDLFAIVNTPPVDNLPPG